MYVKNLGTISVALVAAPALSAPAFAAEPSAVPVANSYAELLEPIPNAAEKLRMADLQAAQRPARLIPAEWGFAHHHHHHHHHHHSHWVSPYYYNYGYSPYYAQPYNYNLYYGRGYYRPYGYRQYYHHHHHHHHHHNHFRRW